MTPRGPRVMLLFALLALTALGGWLRLRTVSFGLPARQNYDEKYMFEELELLRSGRPDVRSDPALGIYPLLLPRLVRACGTTPTDPPARSPEEELERAGRDLRLLRTFAALLALLTVPCTYFLARRFADVRTALLATALMATSLLHLWYSGQARPHAPASGGIALALVGALAIRSGGALWAYALGTLGALLAIGSSQIGLGVLPSLALAHLLRRRAGPRWVQHAACAASALVILWGAWLFCPGWFQRGATLAPIETEASSFTGKGFGRIALGLWHFEPFLVGLALAGLAYWMTRLRSLWQGRAELAIVCAWALPYLASILVFDRSAQRYFLPLLPWTAALAAWTLLSGARRLGRFQLVPVVALCALQALLAWKASSVLAAPDTSADAARWIERELAPGKARIALLPGLDLPLRREPESVRAGYYLEQKLSSWARYQGLGLPAAPGASAWKLSTLPLHGGASWKRAREDPRGFLAEAGAEYVVVELAGRAFVGEVVEALRSCTTPVARFSPMRVDTGDDTPFLWWDHQNEYREGPWWIARLLEARSMGSVLEIRRVPPR